MTKELELDELRAYVACSQQRCVRGETINVKSGWVQSSRALQKCSYNLKVFNISGYSTGYSFQKPCHFLVHKSVTCEEISLGIYKALSTDICRISFRFDQPCAFFYLSCSLTVNLKLDIFVEHNHQICLIVEML